MFTCLLFAVVGFVAAMVVAGSEYKFVESKYEVQNASVFFDSSKKVHNMFLYVVEQVKDVVSVVVKMVKNF